MQREMTIKAILSNLDLVLEFVNEYLETNGCDRKLVMQLDVAVEEIYVNIAHYAYGSGDGTAKISMDIDEEERLITIEFRDSGMEFDPLARPDPDTSLSAEDRPIGGLGIFMVKKSMDDVTYSRIGGENILTLYKKY